MRLVEPPQRLHRNIEGAVADDAEAPAFLDQPAQLGRRLAQSTGRVESRDLAVLAIEAEDALIAGDLAAYAHQRALRQRGIGVPQRQFREGAQHLDRKSTR